MIIGDIKMIGTITDKMTVMIKDKTLITGIFLRKETTTTDNHITVIVIPMKENIISSEDSISVLINQKDHGSSNTTMKNAQQTNGLTLFNDMKTGFDKCNIFPRKGKIFLILIQHLK